MKNEMLNEDAPIRHEVDGSGYVVVGGEVALDAKGQPIKRRATTDVMCQRCGAGVTVGLEIFGRYEPSLKREMYFHGLAISWEQHCRTFCAACVAKGAA